LFLQRILDRINRLSLFWSDDLPHYRTDRSLYIATVRDRIEADWQAWELAQIDIDALKPVNMKQTLPGNTWKFPTHCKVFYFWVNIHGKQIDVVIGMSGMKRIFSHISQVNLWQSNESVSGRGSELDCTANIRARLPDLLQTLNIASIVDAPCGDFNWMRYVPFKEITYTGIDVVPAIIEQNQQRYSTNQTQFLVGDITKNRLPTADLIICRDCFVHLSFWDISCALKQFQQSGAHYLLTTTYPTTAVNHNSPTGSWRALNLQQAPFNFPAPLELLADPSDDTQKNPDKSLGLWKLNDLPRIKMARWNSPQVMLVNLIRTYFDPSWKL
jgi:hypothetical protein